MKDKKVNDIVGIGVLRLSKRLGSGGHFAFFKRQEMSESKMGNLFGVRHVPLTSLSAQSSNRVVD